MPLILACSLLWCYDIHQEWPFQALGFSAQLVILEETYSMWEGSYDSRNMAKWEGLDT
jgi:hypothetical protein